MLWYKAWLDTRWRFLAALGILSCVAFATIFAYSSVQGLLSMVASKGADGPLASELTELAQLSKSFRGYIWAQFVRQNLLELWILFAVLVGSEGLIARGRGAVFTLSLPVSRDHLCIVRAATNLTELCVLALIPMLLIALLAPAAGHSYALEDALVLGFSSFAGGAVFYCLSALLAAVLWDRWKATVIALAAAVAIYLCTRLMPAVGPYSPISVMGGDSYFQTGESAWVALFTWLVISVSMLYAAVRSVRMRDF
jgi:hypothetical protein